MFADFKLFFSANVINISPQSFLVSTPKSPNAVILVRTLFPAFCFALKLLIMKEY